VLRYINQDNISILMTADHTTLKVSKKLTAKLKEIGGKGETYEDIIWRLIGSKK
jgi:hypothetical protein